MRLAFAVAVLAALACDEKSAARQQPASPAPIACTVEGAECRTSEACPRLGRCLRGACVDLKPALREAWTYTSPATRTFFFDGLVDSAGRVYWTECNGPWQCELVSAARDGAIRFRQKLATAARGPVASGPDPVGGSSMLLGDLVVSARGPDLVEARRTSDGSLAWRRNVRDALRPQLASFDPDETTARVKQLASLPDGSVVLLLDVDGGWILSLSGDGALRWSYALGGGDRMHPGVRVVVDEAGRVFAGSDTTGLHALSSDGRRLWHVEATETWPVMAAGGRVLFSRQATLPWRFEVRDAADGRLVLERGDLVAMGLASGSIFGFAPGQGFARTPVDGGDVVPIPSAFFGAPVTFTSRETMLFVHERERAVEARLADGAASYECAIARREYAGSASGLRAGLWAITSTPHPLDATGAPLVLHAFDLPGAEPSPSGWSSLAGSADQDYRAR